MCPPQKDDDPKSSPRVLFGNGVRSAGSAAGPRVLFGSPAPARTPSDGPRIVGNGVLRHRLTCSPADLRLIDPEASAGVVKAALRIVDGVNLDDHEFDDVIRFGGQLQQRHGQLAEEELALADDPLLAEAGRLSADLLEHLTALDPERLFPTGKSLLDGFRASMSGTTPDELFRRHASEIARIGKLLADRASGFLELERSARSLSERGEALSRGLDAHLLAARFVAHFIETHVPDDAHLTKHYGSQKDAIESRISSLAATSASTLVGARTLEAIVASIAEARSFAGELVERDLPAWRTSVAAALAARAQEPSRAVDLSAIRKHYAQLLTKLLRKDAI